MAGFFLLPLVVFQSLFHNFSTESLAYRQMSLARQRYQRTYRRSEARRKGVYQSRSPEYGHGILPGMLEEIFIATYLFP